MAFSFVVETGAIIPDANSFCTVAFADDFLAMEPAERAAQWADLADEEKERRLAYATRWIADRALWRGTVVEATQPLPWPREGAKDRNGNEIASTVVPIEVKRATALLAIHHLTEDAEEGSIGLRRFRADTFEIEYQIGYLGRATPAFLKHVLFPLCQFASDAGFKKIVKA